MPKTTSSENIIFKVKEISNIGISAGATGLSLGYSGQKVIILPHENAFYIEVTTEEQFKQLQEFLQQQKEAKLWVVKQPGAQ